MGTPGIEKLKDPQTHPGFQPPSPNFQFEEGLGVGYA